jgi:hypothetical protein
MKPIFIVDIDGTVCDSSALIDKTTGRYHAVVDSWDDKQMLACLEEACRQPVVSGAEVLSTLMRLGYHAVFLTGRSEALCDSLGGRRLTMEWLCGTFGMPEGVGLFMRPKNDNRGNAEAKLDVFERQVLPSHPHGNFVFLDDDMSVLAAYAKHGLVLKAPECWAALAHFLPKDPGQ